MNIVRGIAGVVVGLIIMNIIVIALLSAAWLALGPEFAFEPGTWETRTAWVSIGVGINAASAISGGLICGLIAVRRSIAPYILAALVLVSGLAMAALGMIAEPDPARPASPHPEISLFEAVQHADPPLISVWLTPFIGAAGVLIGARLSGGGRVKNRD